MSCFSLVLARWGARLGSWWFSRNKQRQGGAGRQRRLVVGEATTDERPRQEVEVGEGGSFSTDILTGEKAIDEEIWAERESGLVDLG